MENGTEKRTFNIFSNGGSYWNRLSACRDRHWSIIFQSPGKREPCNKGWGGNRLELIAQKFEAPFYFVPRPSAINYDAATSGGTNNGPTSEALKSEVGQNVSMARKMFGLKEGDQVPADMVTSSGSGLDPEISFDSAMIQVKSVANARKAAETEIAKLVEKQVTKDLFSPKRINVLLLNLELDRLFPKGTK